MSVCLPWQTFQYNDLHCRMQWQANWPSMAHIWIYRNRATRMYLWIRPIVTYCQYGKGIGRLLARTIYRQSLIDQWRHWALKLSTLMSNTNSAYQFAWYSWILRVMNGYSFFAAQFRGLNFLRCDAGGEQDTCWMKSCEHSRHHGQLIDTVWVRMRNQYPACISVNVSYTPRTPLQN